MKLKSEPHFDTERNDNELTQEAIPGHSAKKSNYSRGQMKKAAQQAAFVFFMV